MLIRELNAADIPELVLLEKTAQLAPWSLAAFERCFALHYQGWAADEGGAMQGFIMLSLKVGECHILNLSVYPHAQHQGIGSALLRYALRWAKQAAAGMVYLEVRRSNFAALALYRKMNFRIIGERKDYYPSDHGSREDALIFARDLGIEGPDTP